MNRSLFYVVALHFVQGEFGPFNPSMPTSVPLWLAVSLKKQHRCHIQPPEWLNIGKYMHTATPFSLLYVCTLTLSLLTTCHVMSSASTTARIGMCSGQFS